MKMSQPWRRQADGLGKKTLSLNVAAKACPSEAVAAFRMRRNRRLYRAALRDKAGLGQISACDGGIRFDATFCRINPSLKIGIRLILKLN